MIHVLGIPTLSRYDLLERLLDSIDEPVGRIVIVDNGGSCPEFPGTHVLHMPSNLGVAASWNLVIKATRAPWWLLANDDLTFGPGDLAHLADVMEPAAQVITLAGFAAFGINRAAIERVGFFDENFHPAYDEDCDYEYRCRLVGVPIMDLPNHVEHARSATIGDPIYRTHNERTHAANHAYFVRKWGGVPRSGERFRTPFDRGEDVGSWQLSIGRLDELAWELAP